MKILIVEDQKITAEDIRFQLEDLGYTVTGMVDSGKAALEKVAETRPDFILMDIILKGELDGIETALRIRDRFNIPVVYITAHGEKSIFNRAKHTNPLGYILKPLEEAQFRVGIEMATQLYKAEKELLNTNQTLQETIAQLNTTQGLVVQQERLRVIEQMSSGINHNINNALTPILGYTELLLNYPTELDLKVKRYLQNMHTSAQDIAEMVRSLGMLHSTYAGSNGSGALVDLNTLIVRTITLTQPKWKDEAQSNNITIRVETDLREIPLLAGSAADWGQVLANLIFNAVGAMPNGGVIRFHTYLDGGHVLIKISDTGTGMTAEAKERCFDPFFTTKHGRGAGLGLTMVYQTLGRHKGQISVESELGMGTTFTVRLPAPSSRSIAASQPIAENELQEKATSRSLHVLVVEDEPLVCESVKAYLTLDGHTVETAGDGREGLQKFQASRFDLVLTDRAMPEMNGDQLAATIKQMVPNQPVIMMTGFGDLMEVRGQHPTGVDEIVSKPITLNRFRQVLATVEAELQVRHKTH